MHLMQGGAGSSCRDLLSTSRLILQFRLQLSPMLQSLAHNRLVWDDPG